ncbi:MAG: hypothetical protein LBI14_08835 [Treponema sp.]|jgi:purine-nucleoside phosphorylase|nr:hypothetical protein [Treponema sp.]
MTITGKKQNIVILTATEGEFVEIRKIIQLNCGKNINQVHGNGIFYDVFPITIGYTVFNLYLGYTEQGNSEAATYSTLAITNYEPVLLLFVGTCGYIKNFSIGDTLIVGRAFDVLRGKDTDEGFMSKPCDERMDKDMQSLCRAFTAEINRGDVLNKIYKTKGYKSSVVDCASSPMIVAGKDTFSKNIIKGNYANTEIVEMETYGFYTATYHAGFKEAVMVRAVSDDSTEKSPGSDVINQPKALENVGYFVMELINYVIPVISKKKTEKQQIEGNHSYPKITTVKPQLNGIEHLLNVPKFSSKKLLFCGFLSFKMLDNVDDRFHLGHCYFMHIVNMLRQDSNVIIFLCASLQNLANLTVDKINKYYQLKKEIIDKWEKCFDKKIKIIDIDDYLNATSFDDSDFLKKFNQCYRDIYRNFSKQSINTTEYSNLLRELINWRNNGSSISSGSLKIIKNCLQIEHNKNYSNDEIISVGYIMAIRPTWLRQEWFADFLLFWTHAASTMFEKEFGSFSIKNTFIIESMRNAYAWDTTAFFAKKMDKFHTLPRKLLFNNILNLDRNCYMKSSQKDSAIFLNGFSEDKLFLSNDFIKEVAEIFKIDYTEDIVKQIIYKYKDLLGIR